MHTRLYLLGTTLNVFCSTVQVHTVDMCCFIQGLSDIFAHSHAYAYVCPETLGKQRCTVYSMCEYMCSGAPYILLSMCVGGSLETGRHTVCTRLSFSFLLLLGFFWNTVFWHVYVVNSYASTCGYTMQKKKKR